MNNSGSGAESAEWDPCDDRVDRRLAYDEQRQRCPVAHSDALGWSLLGHAEVMAALADPGTFSSRVSARTAVPNGMDPPQHTGYREVVDRSFAAPDVAAFEPAASRIAGDLIHGAMATESSAEVMASVAEPFAARVQCAYLGWSDAMAAALQRWNDASNAAKASGDRAQLDRVARDFDRVISRQLADAHPPGSPATITERLVGEQIQGRPLTHDELVSMFRNWTAGELGTIAAAVGIIVEFLGRNPQVRGLLRDRPHARQRAIDEMLRLDAPLLMNRRRTAVPAVMDHQVIPAESKVTIMWSAAQRDPAVFPAPAHFRMNRAPRDNLLYGRGPHRCPGEGLARVELGAFLDRWLRQVPDYQVLESTRAPYPAGGFSTVLVSRSKPGQ